jgi:hypothetical protein
MVKIFTMVKDELDIVIDWVIYHGYIFGFANLYIIDNYSNDGTYEALLKMKEEFKINIIRLPDYKKKGLYITYFIRNICKNELAFPIDIDEFIVCYNKTTNKISSDKKMFFKELCRLPQVPIYKMNYIDSKILITNGYKRATVESKYGKYNDQKDFAKSFFHSRLFKGIIDHGNHFRTEKYYLSNFCLVHFHTRNIEQIKMKIYNNVYGLGYPHNDIQKLKQILNTNPSAPGHHHIKKQISVLEGTFSIPKDKYEDCFISLEPLNSLIDSLI